MVEGTDTFVRVASVDQIPEGSLLAVEAEGHAVCLANVEGTLYALQDNCSHQDFALSEGELDGGTVECVLHGARFEVASGRALALPAIRPVKTYDVRVDGDDVLVDLG
ncbi:MAG: non-heme iron oxygenase ferredoxin subunit [Gemmatimonadota bacterium]